jgi:hypothetical protein
LGGDYLWRCTGVTCKKKRVGRVWSVLASVPYQMQKSGGFFVWIGLSGKIRPDFCKKGDGGQGAWPYLNKNKIAVQRIRCCQFCWWQMRDMTPAMFPYRHLFLASQLCALCAVLHFFAFWCWCWCCFCYYFSVYDARRSTCGCNKTNINK